MIKEIDAAKTTATKWPSGISSLSLSKNRFSFAQNTQKNDAIFLMPGLAGITYLCIVNVKK